MGAKCWKSLSISSGEKIPRYSSANTNDDTNRESNHPLLRAASNRNKPQNKAFSGLLSFCQTLKHATNLTKLELSGYLLEETELRALFQSLVLTSEHPRIERLSLFSCARVSPDVYARVLLCGGDINHES